MTQVSVAEAAELVGRSRKTIYRHIDNGSLSVTRDNDNVIQVDIAELIRVYGELSTPEETKEAITKIEEVSRNEAEDKLIAAEKKIAVLEERVRGLNSLIDSKDENIEILNKTIYLIEDKSEKEKMTETKTEKGFFQRLFNK